MKRNRAELLSEGENAVVTALRNRNRGWHGMLRRHATADVDPREKVGRLAAELQASWSVFLAEEGTARGANSVDFEVIAGVLLASWSDDD